MLLERNVQEVGMNLDFNTVHDMGYKIGKTLFITASLIFMGVVGGLALFTAAGLVVGFAVGPIILMLGKVATAKAVFTTIINVSAGIGTIVGAGWTFFEIKDEIKRIWSDDTIYW